MSAPSTVRRPRLDRALVQAGLRREEHLRALAGWLAVPSVSGDPRRRDDVLRAGAVLAGLLRTAGATVHRIPLPGAPPLVVGRVDGGPGAATVVLYGHYDVVPPGPGWRTAAFRPALDAHRLVGRGANDDKGQLMAAVAALHGWRRAGGCPASVWVVAEGAEEVSSPGLAAGLATLARHVRPDLVLVCDTERAADGVPSVTVSQRGHLDLAVQVATGGTPVHPGRLGGAVVDPAVVLSQVLVRLTAVLDAAGRRGARSSAHPRLHRRTDGQVATAAGRRATTGTGLDRRTTELPALSVLRLSANAGTRAVPVRASALLDVRLPPSADPAAAVRQLRAAARDVAPPGVRVTVSAGASHGGHELLPAPGHLAAVDSASRATFGSGVRLVRSGGSLPAAALLADAFPPTPVLLGLGTPGGRAHGPDEYLDLTGWSASVALLVRLLGSPCLRAPPVRST